MISPTLDARRLTCFIAVAETLHFRKAAERLRLAQPALSQQIRRLEEELGCQLLKRDRRRVELTPAGRTLLEAGRRALVHLSHAAEAAQRTSREQQSLLRVGFVNPAAFALVPDVLRGLRAEHPDVHLMLREADSVTLLEEVRLGQLDVAFVRGPVIAPGVRVDTLRREPLVLVLPSRHRLARRARVPLEQLADEPFIGFARDTAPSLHDAMMGMCLEAGFTPTFVTEAVEWFTMVSLVAAGLGCAILPESVRTFSREGAVYRAVAGAPRHVDLVIARAPTPPGPALKACLRIVSRMTSVALR
ncbi:LysR family transcriptional regulator [Myxococcus llanfairpwllgwyngyllgogerychwyrndrobwllllantysiliogogogochensis]|uniref:LysR family transcriptional regulator n=1 Tax=Myxococcus llanfairpwllgwyngyllgogerychwyrndrobwllllantysiliogogogochensis TaxID=2590453 RepID=A0A540X102_9BACT|nr:LysR family transcriptional regulator [Myxococcus llanfairpwllgwyngyllgogerychwyrndrobwllllantysiliogogogochensis]TQF14957.1 LysR family transcriptional regulator [Myxococcus llanfairpwllgwyngyllgogerychwyrndrobwllllantysiliogogogochensis]